MLASVDIENLYSRTTMTESSLSILEDPWNTPSVMAITPPLLPKHHHTKDTLPSGSTEWQKIMNEMYAELEMEKRIRSFVESENIEDKVNAKNSMKHLPRAVSIKPLNVNVNSLEDKQECGKVKSKFKLKKKIVC